VEDETLYDRLKIRIDASESEIKDAFRKLAKQYHPDVTGREASSDKFQSIRTAYEILIDPILRKNYNQSLRDSLDEKKKNRFREKLASIDTITKLEIILAWSTMRPSFNVSFTVSLLNHMAEGKSLSARQLDCIDNVISSFDIDVDLWIDDEKRFSCIKKLFDTL